MKLGAQVGKKQRLAILAFLENLIQCKILVARLTVKLSKLMKKEGEQ